MSGAEDLQLFEQLVDNANSLFLSDEDFVVINGVTKPTLKKIYADFMASTGTFITVDEGLEATNGTGTNNRFFTVPEAGNTYETRYRNDAGMAVQVGRISSADAVEELSSLVQAFNSAELETELLFLIDPEGGLQARLTNKRLSTIPFEVASQPEATLLGDSEGGAAFYCDEFGAILGHLETKVTDLPGIFVVDLDWAILNPLSDPLSLSASTPVAVDPFEGGLLFNPLIVTGENAESFIHVNALLAHRDRADLLIATLASTSTSALSSGEVLPVSQLRFGAQAVLNLRATAEPNNRRFMTLNLRNVPLQVGSPTVKVLMIGDSITNYAGAYILRQYLEGLGFAPQFLGTVNGAGPGEGANGTSGPLSEGRHGWQARDFTYALDRKLVVAAGDEAAYLTMSKADKVNRNPFLRAATPEDSDTLVRNGYLVDMAFYQSRFGLDTPDIVISSLGTNDALNVSSSEIYTATLDADRILHSQIMAAWPSVKILRTLPGTAMDANRNALWTSSYTQLIAALQQSARDLGDRVTVAPLWAMTNPEAGYAPPTGPAGPDGFIAGNWNDDIHPVGASRYGYYQAMAPFVAAQKINLI
ncbi:SGNH/GDSL hydrolase family protein [Pseudomonas taetrolens]|uniref:SGNH/GDSL hydrolase family protein n=1 Tax=Pseudomonas taetrolens TaxID=47884 RepID=UPI003F9B65A7